MMMKVTAAAAAVGMVLVSTAAGVSARSGPPDRVEVPVGIDFPDFENGLVVFVNTTRDAVCTPDQLNAELDFLEWADEWGEQFFEYLEENDGDPSGFEGPFPPPEPPRPPGIELITVQSKETGKGAIVESARGSDIPTELWHQVEDPPGVGPCTDTLGETEPYATGTSSVRANDNNLQDSPSRNTSFGNSIRATLTDGEGNEVIYVNRFHLNFRCNAPEFGPPACLVERVTIR